MAERLLSSIVVGILTLSSCIYGEEPSLHGVPKVTKGHEITVQHIPNYKIEKPSKRITLPSRTQYSWEAPYNWLTLPPDTLNLSRYFIESDTNILELSLTELPGDAGGRDANINRWRKQLELPPLSKEELNAQVTSYTTQHNFTFQLVTLNQDKSPNTPFSAIQAAILTNETTSLFIKARSSSTYLEEFKPQFLAFLNTLELEK